MGKRLRKAPQGTASIKSFFTPLGKPSDLDGLSSSESEDSDVVLEMDDSDSDWESKPKSKRKRPRKAMVTKKLEKAKVKEVLKKEGKPTKKSKEPEVKVIDEDVAAFLRSGIPSVTARAKQLLDLRREEEEATKFDEFFPKITHIPAEDPIQSFPDHSIWEGNLGLNFVAESSLSEFLPTSDKSPVLEITELLDVKEICCESKLSENVNGTSSSEPVPWVEKYSVSDPSELAVEEETVSKIQTWLRCWKRDIKDDNGRSRKILEKQKKKGNGESDFITSDEDSELQTTSLLLRGPTGTGKTATVMALAKKMGFKVVEVNFSTARSGKEVLKRVEEATLSNLLEVGQTGLLLFEDVCLIEPREDEGFVAAVAQLITSSRRPIIMTVTTSTELISVGGDCDSLVLDTKIEKKDPMSVYFYPQPAASVVEKALLPIVRAENPDLHEDLILPFLNSVARHTAGDIRQSINQLQLVLGSSQPIQQFHRHIAPLIDLNFVREPIATRPSYRRLKSSPSVASEVKVGKKSKGEFQKEMKELASMAIQLDFAVMLDRVESMLYRRFQDERRSDDDLKTGRSGTIRSCFDENIKLCCRLHEPQRDVQDSGTVDDDDGISNELKFSSILFDSDDDLARERMIQQLNLDLEPYCGSEGELMNGGHFNFLNFSYFRTISKNTKLKALQAQKRNRRISYYFNRVPPNVVNCVYDTLDFPTELKRAQQRCYQLD